MNGFGRIGRAIARIAVDKNFMTIEAINTSKTTPKMLAYTLKYDSVYRRFNHDVSASENGITVDGRFITAYNQRNPEEIPWSDHTIDVVVDCTGVFKDREGLQKHIQGTVKKVILSVPSSDESIKHVVIGVNSDSFDFSNTDIISNASCTTNCSAVLVKVLHEAFGFESGFLSTIHAYTSSQSVVDEAADKPTRGRAAALSIIPTTTGASDAVGKVVDIQANQMAGMALRVPTPVGSISDITALLKRDTNVEEVNKAFKEKSEGTLQGILGYLEEELVSSDFIGSPYSCTFDSNYTQVLHGNLVKVFGWYDNEWGYSNRIVDIIEKLSML